MMPMFGRFRERTLPVTPKAERELEQARPEPAHDGRLRPHGVAQSERLVNRYEGRHFVSGVLSPKGTRCPQDGVRSATELHHWLALVTLSDGAL
jgi:hypothetical protein